MMLTTIAALLVGCPQLTQSLSEPQRAAIRATQPRRYEVRFRPRAGIADRGSRAVAHFLPDGALRRIEPGSLRARLWIGSVEVSDLDSRTSVLQPGPYDARQAVIALNVIDGRAGVRWEIAYNVWVAASEVDEPTLARIPWPREWPDELNLALEHTTAFPAEDPLFIAAVGAAVDGPPRLTAPYLVAKQLVGYCVRNVRVVADRRNLAEPRRDPRPDLRERRESSPVTWYRRGTRQAAVDGVGSDPDLLAVCVTTLRAGGIPARVVVGIHEVQRMLENDQGLRRVERVELVAWGEFYLPAVGWIPFDPAEIDSMGQLPPIGRRWPGFGFASHLNERVPLTYDFEISDELPRIEIIPRATTR